MKDLTTTEAKMEAARLALGYVQAIPRCPKLTPDVDRELDAIELWLRRRSVGGDKIAIRQLEKERGRQVRLK